MTVLKVYIEGIEEPIIGSRVTIDRDVFFCAPFIRDPVTGRWFPRSAIRYIEVEGKA